MEVPRVTRLHWGVAAVLVAAALVWAWSALAADRPPGPLAEAPAHAWAIEAAVDRPFTDGFTVVWLTGDQDAVIESIELEGADDGLELVGAKLAGPDRGYGSVQHFKAWPPKSYRPLDPSSVVDAEGATITPDQAGWELLLGIKATKEGYLTREGIRVNYTVDGEKFSRVLPSTLFVCGGDGKVDVDNRCPLGEGFSDF